MALLLFWKRQGPTSHSALGELSRLIGHKRKGGKSGIGHTGTLDPFAEGLLLVGVGEGTKLLSALMGQDKTYIATFDFAHHSQTFDTESDPIKNFDSTQTSKISESLTQSFIEDFLRRKIGSFSQVPPQTSAVHVDGKRAYEWARLGVEKELKARDAEIKALKVLSWSWPELQIELRVSSGTYIRSLARDWGIELCAHAARLTRLVRCSIGPWHIEEGEVIKEKPYKFLNLEDLSSEFSLKYLNEYELRALKNGSWSGDIKKKSLLMGEGGIVRAWADLTDGQPKLQRLFLEDPLKILE